MIRNKKYRIIRLLLKVVDVILDSKKGKKLESDYREFNNSGSKLHSSQNVKTNENKLKGE